MEYQLANTDDWFGEAEQTPAPHAVNPLQIAHRCLRGRYLLACALGVLLAIPCAIAGYLAVAPKYTSVGVVSINPSLPYVLYESELNEPLTAFDSYVRSQANMLRGQRVLDKAMTDPELVKAGWSSGPEGYVAFEKSLAVNVGNREQDIFVTITHEDPKKARAAVNAVLAAYEELAIDAEREEIRERLDELDKFRKKFAAEAQAARNEVFRIAESEGTDDLARRRDAKHDQWAKLEQLIDQFKIDLVPFGGAAGTPAGTGTAPAAPDGVTLDALAQSDPEIAKLIQQRNAVRVELEALRRRFADGHRAVRSAVQDLETTESMIAARASLLRGSSAGGATPGATPTSAADNLRAQLAALERLRDDAANEAKRLGAQQLKIERHRGEEARAQEQYRLADERYRAYEAQRDADKVGRIGIAQQGSVPYRPSTDRRVPLAVLGALGGGAVGVGAVGLVGFLLPRYRYIDDLGSATTNVFVYGAVPELDASDAQSRELVAASVAQVRSVIDARLLGTADRALVHLVTSAGASEGKSTIALRLAKSFAATGRRTLLIDADLIGQRLSAEFGLRGRSGFADCIVGRTGSERAVHETNVRDLFLMPCGNTEATEPEQISARRVESLLDPQRDVFQAIVVDTGPVLGSLEAQAVAATADEVMLIITRGRDVRHVRMAIDRLRRLGARRVGVVFNRASRQDVERSTSISVTSQRTAEVRASWGANGTHEHHAAHENGSGPARNAPGGEP